MDDFDEEEVGLLRPKERNPSVVNDSTVGRSPLTKTLIFAMGLMMLTGFGFVVVQTVRGSKEIADLSVEVIIMQATSRTVYSTLSSDERRSLFESFKSTYGKSYQTEEEETERYTNFLAFLETIDHRNERELAAGGSAVHGVTKFADLSLDEFKKYFLGYNSKKGTSGKNTDSPTRQSDQLHDSEITEWNATVLEEVTGYSSRNWVGVSTTAVKNQGYCGSCWAFSATEQIESDSIRLGLLTTDDALSPQQIVSCDNIDYGCDGGDTETAYTYVMNTGGIESAEDYPYVAYYGDDDATCNADSSDYLVTVVSYSHIYSEYAMGVYMLETGPISVCLYAETWSTYSSGIMSYCGENEYLDHCVQAVALNLNKEYWLVRNSWGTDWGLEGYIKLSAGNNTCLISDDATVTITEAV